jgi:hypothetical protein
MFGWDDTVHALQVIRANGWFDAGGGRSVWSQGWEFGFELEFAQAEFTDLEFTHQAGPGNSWDQFKPFVISIELAATIDIDRNNDEDTNHN